MTDVAIIGGGAAGFFAAINIKVKHPDLKVIIYEKSKTLLGKVRVSGGGRCNVTHACFSVPDLIQYYPRGHKELQSVFHRFNPTHTIQWFSERGVKLKKEEDGRMFPVTDNSETIIDCFMDECRRLDVIIKTGTAIQSIDPVEGGFNIIGENETYKTKKVVVTTGSSDHFWQMLKKLGHTLVAPVPSLFTFNIKDPLVEGLQGVSISKVTVKLSVDPAIIKKLGLNKKVLTQSRPLLFTHWGLSGPSILKLSAVGARLLNHQNYRFEIEVNFCDSMSEEEVIQILNKQKELNPKKQVSNTTLLNLPARFWQQVIQLSINDQQITWADLSKKEILQIAKTLTGSRLQVNGKSTFKEEFVTAGGISLKEVDFKTMQSKLVPNLYFAGEVLDIDALTGGFNFQSAWSEAWVISESVQIP